MAYNILGIPISLILVMPEGRQVRLVNHGLAPIMELFSKGVSGKTTHLPAEAFSAGGRYGEGAQGVYTPGTSLYTLSRAK